jgi:type II secretory pathway pseudopilin PulG
MRSKQTGFTIVELLFVISTLLSIALACGIAYVAFHFIAKFW